MVRQDHEVGRIQKDSSKYTVLEPQERLSSLLTSFHGTIMFF